MPVPLSLHKTLTDEIFYIQSKEGLDATRPLPEQTGYNNDDIVDDADVLL